MDTFRAGTTDDLLRQALQHILRTGVRTSQRRGEVLELAGAALELLNPRARLSRTEARGRIYSCLGEFCWYLSGSNLTDPISYYIPAYRDEDEDGRIHGGYGPRIFDWSGVNQLANVLDLLKMRPSSRQAVIQLFDRNDLVGEHRDVPCTCTLQFLIREQKLNMVAYMRSNDAWLGLPHDLFCFTMLQELLARTLGIDLGRYVHFVGSLHIYEQHTQDARAFLNEGWQSSAAMPGMPLGDPWQGVAELRAAEEQIRVSETLTGMTLPQDPYWADLARLLMIYRMSRANESKSSIELIRASMSSTAFDVYILPKLDRSGN